MPVRSRDRVRALLADAADGLDAHQVAEALDLHVTTARFHLNNLVEEGSVVAQTLQPGGVGRPRVLYATVPAPPEHELLHLLLRQLGSTESEREQSASTAGRAWAQAHARPVAADSEAAPATPDPVAVPDPVVVLESVLSRLGFRITDVVSAFGDHRVKLCSCPLKSIAERNPEIAHGVVRGAVEYALEEASLLFGGSYTVDVSPDPGGDCELQLSLARVRHFA